MAKTGRTEATVLAFRRELVFAGVHVARIGLRQAENSTFHSHRETRDTFYVMAGCLTIDVRVDSSPTPRPYHLLKVGSQSDSLDDFDPSAPKHRLVLHPGDLCVVEPGVVHCAMNLDLEPCHFLCIEGIGEYDFREVGAS
jgi:mannose-6-phosphate isomerase-like protein (cupin superfamily)